MMDDDGDDIIYYDGVVPPGVSYKHFQHRQHLCHAGQFEESSEEVLMIQTLVCLGRTQNPLPIRLTSIAMNNNLQWEGLLPLVPSTLTRILHVNPEQLWMRRG